jgi:Cd2+/Zn2+-exporting ATPase
MDCPTEENLLRDKLQRIPEVLSLDFNLIQRLLTVHHTLDSTDKLQQAILQLGMSPEALGEEANPAPSAAERSARWPLALALGLAVAAEAIGWWAEEKPLLPFSLLLSLISLSLSGIGVYKKGWVAISNGNLNINALMSIAVSGALLLQQWPEAATVMALFAIAERIEAASLERARAAIRSLIAMTPQLAMVQQDNGAWRLSSAATVQVGSRVRLRPGERVALDGTLLRGRGALNQAPITGESIPVDKQAGDTLLAGSINLDSELEYRVDQPASNSMLARIIHALEAAQGIRAPTQRFVDQFARVYTPIILFLAVLVATFAPMVLGSAWSDWLYRALVLLVIACPCALVVSTPVTIVSGLAAAARQGILIKGGVYLEQGERLAWLALDKTGTITHGKPILTETEILAPQVKNQTKLAASLAARSDHPVSRALIGAIPASERLEVQGFSALPGAGIRGRINGTEYFLLNHRALHDKGLCSARLEDRLETLEKQGKTTVMLADQHAALALFVVADTIKPESRKAISELHALGVKTLMLSGDNPFTVAAIAREIGIDQAHGNQLPQDKANAIAELAARTDPRCLIGMAGDGINDAPALAHADIGFAMGASGSDTAIETADVALMDDDLRKIPAFIRLSRRSKQILRQNISLALGIKAVFLILTLLGHGSMWMAVFADMGASLLVVANGLRLLRPSA